MVRRKRIATITLNPAIDTMYRLDSFQINKGHRTEAPIRTAGGKGLNVSRIARCLNEEVVATGFLGGNNGEFIRNEIQKLGIEDRFITIAGETRVCLAFNDSVGNQTEVMEYGPNIMESDLAKLVEDLPSILKQVDIIVISGSLPRGCSSEIYQYIIKEAAKWNVKALLDTSGHALKESLSSNPFMIKPNLHELEQLIEKTVKNEDDIWDAIKEIDCQYSIPLIIISNGENGCFVSHSGKLFKVQSVDVSVVNPVGSGDSFVAGIAVGLLRDLNIENTLLLATACGAANAVEAMTGYANPDNVKLFMEQIKLGTAI